MAQTVPNLCVSRKVFLKHQVNWNTVCGAIREQPGRYICLSDNPVEVLNEHLSLLSQPRSSVCVTRISIGLMISAGMLLASSSQEAHLRWTRELYRVNWEEFVRCQEIADETYSEAKRQFSDRNRDILMNV